MITVDCPCCEEAIHTEDLGETLRCDGCRIELQLAPDVETAELARAA